jgi:myo-inositol-1(or 4)-monophosphatase
MEPTLNDLINIALKAGEILKNGYGKTHQIEFKGAIDPVTEVDHESEQTILQEIHSHFPGHRIVTEESGILDGDHSHTWYIDPLDGTVNFSHDIPIFCVSIAYGQGGTTTHGVVYDPIRAELFAAEKGKGATLNEKPIHLSGAKVLDRALLVTGFPYDIRTNPENNLENYARFALRTQRVRRLGSAALDLSYVAAGRFDGYWELHLYPWDMAAGGIIVSEAGGVLTDLSGQPVNLASRPSIVTGNPLIHQEILKVLHEDEKTTII